MTRFDLFSEVASNYARYRPTYPRELFQFLFRLCGERRELAWDVATGSGQAAVGVAEGFQRVVATDISAQQIAHAAHRPNITYRLTSATPSEEELDAAVGGPGSVDLITIGQGYHWFDFEHFHRAAARVLRPGGVVAVWCYGLASVTPEFDAVMLEYYKTTWPYWEPKRVYIDEAYRSIPFPFKPLPAFVEGGSAGTGPVSFTSELHWSLHDYFGYLNSWSPVATARRKGLELLNDEAKAKFEAAWGNPEDAKLVKFPISLLIGTV